MHDLGRLAIALSGGVDSTLLAAVARRCLGRDHVLALHVQGPFIAGDESTRAAAWAAAADITLVTVTVDMLANESIRCNDPERCYHCKKRLMTTLLAIARNAGFPLLADGMNLDDPGDYRPGIRAADELGVRHPLFDTGWAKADIRRGALALNLPNHDAPAAACLASRIPAGMAVDADKLRAVDAGEEALLALGFRGARLRHYGDLAKIEVDPGDLETAFARREALLRAMRELGFRSVALDLAGYRRGAVNGASADDASDTKHPL
ncbi:Pyridinium-3,5-biscarboxylic acid mononucleotide sulfurtransferase [bioreactor metagenome]|uniref:Pyridinium-3,5-biscarboxylic acid mononucleotide sulfurtransferase n=1 Tax=bioreactor metagenome TaxID=1076179 RepID=A0A645D9E7_9ZZZZ